MPESCFDRANVTRSTTYYQESQSQKMMPYSSKPLENGRWGIYINNELIATIGCADTCKKIIHFLERRRSNDRLSAFKDSYGINQYFHNLKLRP
ncbi:MAG: hypothetical protein AAFQ41_03060 [Cyanobacteria bacterium J06623_7]